MTVEINAAGTITGLQPNGISSQPVFPGNVLQVVSSQGSDRLQTTSSTYSDIPGFNLTITPTSASSSILVTFSCHTYVRDGSDWEAAEFKLLRDDQEILVGGSYGFANKGEQQMSYQTNHFLDNPSTTSTLTYKLQGARTRGSDLIDFNFFGMPGSITAMEIAG